MAHFQLHLKTFFLGQHVMPDAHDITKLLASVDTGDREVVDRLFLLVYRELRRIAHRQISIRGAGETLNTTALVHEAYLKLVDSQSTQWENRAHFFAISARAMRQILLDYARRKRAQKRGGEWRRVTWDELKVAPLQRAEVLIALDEGLTALSKVDKRMSRIVELRFFGGLTEREIGHVIGVSDRTVRREWRDARAWLSRFLMDPPAEEGSTTD